MKKKATVTGQFVEQFYGSVDYLGNYIGHPLSLPLDFTLWVTYDDEAEDEHPEDSSYGEYESSYPDGAMSLTIGNGAVNIQLADMADVVDLAACLAVVGMAVGEHIKGESELTPTTESMGNA